MKGGRRGKNFPLGKIFVPLEKMFLWYRFIIHVRSKIWAPFRKLFASPGVASWLEACLEDMLKTSGRENSNHFHIRQT